MRTVWFLAALAAVTVMAADQKKEEQTKPTVIVQPQMVVVKDPVSGKVRQATAEEAAELTRKTAATKAKVDGAVATPRMIRGPGGAVGMVLEESSGPAIAKPAEAKAAAKTTSKQKGGANNEK